MKFYRPQHHITPHTGWINDPNGFCYFKGQYHLFAQHNPHGLSWGPMHWLHFVSKDLVHFEEVGIALYPSESYDQEFGCFSGSAIAIDDVLHLYYTGVDGSHQTQCLATSSDGIHFTKFAGNPILERTSLPRQYSETDFRDPKVFQKEGSLYMVVSCRHEEGYGSILLFKGLTPTHFVFVSVLASFPELLSPNVDPNGRPIYGMCECPDVLFLGEEVALMASLQFQPRVGNSFQNVHSVVYSLGKLDLTRGVFTPKTPFLELDHGFDIYATQSLQEGDKTYLVYWENMWDDQNYPDRKEGYCGALSSIRTVTIKDDRLVLNWLPKMKEETNHQVLQIEVKQEDNQLLLGKNILISFHPSTQTCDISRVNMDEPIRFQDGTLRQKRTFDLSLKNQVTLEYCIDRSCAEISLNEGEVSFSLRIYGYSDSDEVKISSSGLGIQIKAPEQKGK